jgi:putative transposase
MFDDDDHVAYTVFEKVLAEPQIDVFVRMLSVCLMPNHWHLVLWAIRYGDLGRFPQ